MLLQIIDQPVDYIFTVFITCNHYVVHIEEYKNDHWLDSIVHVEMAWGQIRQQLPWKLEISGCQCCCVRTTDHGFGVDLLEQLDVLCTLIVVYLSNL